MTADIDRVASTTEKTTTVARTSTTFRGAARKAKRPLRTLAVFGAVGALVAGIALPALVPSAPVASATATLQQIALDDAQSLIIASEVSSVEVERGTYKATTQDEIDKKKAEEAAALRAARLASASSAGAASNIDLNIVAPGSGEVRYPVTNYSAGPRNQFRPPSRPNHNGYDMLAPRGTPIFASTSGVVRISSESYYGYGVAVVIDGVVGGKRVSTTYAHMVHGSRVVSAGQRVEAGQLIGQVGSTGNSNANHLHFEVKLNGGLVDPAAWLRANAG